MNFQVPDEIGAVVRGLVDQGRFASESEAIAEGVRLLASHEALKSEVQIGLSQLDRGEWVNEESAFAAVDAEIAAIEANRPKS